MSSFKNNIIKHTKNIFRYFGFDALKLGNLDFLEFLIYTNYSPDFFFIQIGANDGVTNDPIYNITNDLNLNGIVIEPIKEYYDILVKNYKKNKNIIPLNYAIYEENQNICIYKYKNINSKNDWRRGVSSIIKDHYKKNALNNDNEEIIEETIEAITYEKLFEMYSVQKIDLLYINTSGYDYNLIKLFPFDRYQPKIIQFEHGLPQNFMSKKEYLEVLDMLIEKGYLIISNKFDCIAYLEKNKKNLH